ncbi:MAG: PsiF family protein [Formivibrio sp.]|nr:PsiF family protein [Formivibrio sp.]
MIAARFALMGLAALFAGNVYAANAQQTKMATCNKDATAKALKGDARKAFMSDCLKAKPASAPVAAPTQQEKMKTCNKDAGEKMLKGDARKKFMSECLKK